MYDFSQISIKPATSTKIIVENNSGYPLIGKGAHGAVFKISEEKCVKIYVDKGYCASESKVYTIGQSSRIIPRLYEIGENYIVIEYIDGISLDEYLKKKGKISTHIATQLVFMIREMERLGFTRVDSALRHIILSKDRQLKVVDIIWAYTMIDPFPTKLFRELRKINLIDDFMKKVKEIDSDLFEKWRNEVKEDSTQLFS